MQFPNSDGVSLSLGKNGTLGLTVYLNDGTAVATVDLDCHPSTAYGIDGDGDGRGDIATRVNVCSGDTPPNGYIPNATDCNDDNPAVFARYYRDADGDGYGNEALPICDDATPPAGYVVKSTDCNDTRPDIHPLVPDAQCDAVDDNCNGLLDEEFVDHVSTCGVGACARTGFAHCEFGFLQDTCVPGGPSAETCNNGIDEDCDGTVDDPIPTGTPNVVLSRLAGGVARLTWTAVSGATGYDVARGSMQVLRSSNGDFTAATNACLGNNLGTTTFDDPQALASGQGYWYVSAPRAAAAPATTPAPPGRWGPVTRRSPRRGVRARDVGRLPVRTTSAGSRNPSGGALARAGAPFLWGPSGRSRRSAGLASQNRNRASPTSKQRSRPPVRRALRAVGFRAGGQAARRGVKVLEGGGQTVESHRAQIMERLGVHDLTGLVRFALRVGLISPES